MAVPLTSSSSVSVVLTSTQPPTVDSARAHLTLQRLGKWILGLSAGGELGAVDVQVSTSAAAAASGTLTIASGSGTVGGTINGVAITVTWATSDTATATALAAAINASANALVAGIVAAASVAGVVTITSLEKSKTANAITLVASGTGVTASGARLTGGAGGDVATVNIMTR